MQGFSDDSSKPAVYDFQPGLTANSITLALISNVLCSTPPPFLGGLSNSIRIGMAIAESHWPDGRLPVPSRLSRA